MNRKRLLALPFTLIICFSLFGSVKASIPPLVHEWTISIPPDGIEVPGTPTRSIDQIPAPAILPFPSKVGRPVADISQSTIGLSAAIKTEGDHKKTHGMAQTFRLELAPLGEPAALLLIGSGLIGLAKFGMKKYRKLTSRRVKEIIKIKPPAV